MKKVPCTEHWKVEGKNFWYPSDTTFNAEQIFSAHHDNPGKNAWRSFTAVVEIFLRNIKALYYHNLLKQLLTLWEPGYDIFILRFWPKTSSCQLPYQRHSSSADCARELFKGSNRSDSLLDCTRKKFFGWGLRIFCEWRPQAKNFFRVQTARLSASFDTLNQVRNLYRNGDIPAQSHVRSSCFFANRLN